MYIRIEVGAYVPCVRREKIKAVRLYRLYDDRREIISDFLEDRNSLQCGIRVLWSSGQSSWLHIHRSRVRFPALPDFLRISGSGTGSTQPREDN
jgi:hypothetical protein